MPNVKVYSTSTCPYCAMAKEFLKKNNIQYVAINYNTFNGEKADFLRRLEKEADIAAGFSPYYAGEIRLPYDTTDATFMAIGT
ncbi:MAG: glutaredoxin family protein, partial [Candidatus Omnitrophica bacterium]|nr:glutaredoxin family protein [Candidatus Omnitrophota bacterium]